MKKLRLLLFFLYLPTRSLFADIVYLQNGEVHRGEIIENNAEGIKLKKMLGTMSTAIRFRKDEIDHIEVSRGNKEVFLERYKRTLYNDAQGFYELGVWCEEVGLAQEAKTCFQRANEIDPQHALTALKLGMVKDDAGNWMTYEAYQEQRGQVKLDGKWISKEERDAILLARQDEATSVYQEGIKEWLKTWQSFARTRQGKNQKGAKMKKNPIKDFLKGLDSSIEKFEEARTLYPAFSDNVITVDMPKGEGKGNLDGGFFEERTLAQVIEHTEVIADAANHYAKAQSYFIAGDLKSGQGIGGRKFRNNLLKNVTLSEEYYQRLVQAMEDYSKAEKEFELARKIARSRPHDAYKDLINEKSRQGLDLTEQRKQGVKDNYQFIEELKQKAKQNRSANQGVSGRGLLN